MALVSIALLLLTSIPLAFIQTEAVQNNPKYANYPERTQVLNNVVLLAPSSEPAADDSKTSFDVRSNGAVGDGKTDDSKAFKAAWDSACNETNQAKILVPKGYSFLLQPIGFFGPCQNNLIFQVFF